MEHCSPPPPWRPDRESSTNFGQHRTSASRSGFPRRDDGSGQTASWVVATRPRVPDWSAYPILNGHHQVAASHRPRTEASARRSDNAREGLTTDGPLKGGARPQARGDHASHAGRWNTVQVCRCDGLGVQRISSTTGHRLPEAESLAGTTDQVRPQGG